MGFIDEIRKLRRQIDALNRAVADQDDVLQTHEATLKDHQARIGVLEGVLADVVSKLEDFGQYKQRSADELVAIRSELDSLLNVVDTMVKHAINGAGLQEAKALQKRLRNNRTRVVKELDARASA